MKKTMVLFALGLLPCAAKADPHCWLASYAYNAPAPPQTSAAPGSQKPPQQASGLASYEIRSRQSTQPPDWNALMTLTRANAIHAQLIDQTGVVTPISLSPIACSPDTN